MEDDTRVIPSGNRSVMTTLEIGFTPRLSTVIVKVTSSPSLTILVSATFLITTSGKQ